MNVKEYAVFGVKIHRNGPSDVSNCLKTFDTMDKAKEYILAGQEAWVGQLVIVEFDKYPADGHQQIKGTIIWI